MKFFDDILGAPLRALGIEPSGIPGLSILFDNPNEEKLQGALKNAQAETEKQRKLSQEQRMQALKQMLPLFGPYNQALAQIYGSNYQIPVDQLLNNPMVTEGAKADEDQKTAMAGLSPMTAGMYQVVGQLVNGGQSKTGQPSQSSSVVEWNALTPQQQLDLINKGRK